MVKKMKVSIPPVDVDQHTYDYLSRVAKKLDMDSVETLLAEELREKINELELWMQRIWLVEDAQA